jgi:hypothetical protein
VERTYIVLRVFTVMGMLSSVLPAQGQRMCVAIPPFPQYAFMVWCLVKHRDNFTFTFDSHISVTL